MNGRLVLVVQTPPNAYQGAEKQSSDENRSMRFPQPAAATDHESKRQKADSHQDENDGQNEVQKTDHALTPACRPTW